MTTLSRLALYLFATLGASASFYRAFDPWWKYRVPAQLALGLITVTLLIVGQRRKG